MSLIDQVEDECGGDYKRFMLATLKPTREWIAHECFKAMDDMGGDESVSIQCRVPRTNDELAKIREFLEAAHGEALVDEVVSEMGGDLEKFMVATINGNRDEETVYEGLAAEQAEQLYEAGEGKRFGTDEDVFIEVLTTASTDQIALIADAYEASRSAPPSTTRSAASSRWP